MSDRPIPYSRQQVTAEDVDAVVAALRSDYLTTGPTVLRFEEALARVGGVRRAVAVSSGTAALHAAYFALEIGPGDEIVTSPLTFAATANGALYLGASVRFVDVEVDTGNLNPALLEGVIGERTRVIVPVDYGGHPADYDRIQPIARSRGVFVVSDAAHSLGATYRGRPAGGLADLSATSFHPVKPITTAEGGAVLGDREDLLDRVARFRDHGIERGAAARFPREGPWYYEMQDLGFNYRLSALHCALGLSQLQRLHQHIARRRAIAARYSRALAQVSQLELPVERAEVQSGWHLYVVRVKGDATRRRPFFERLRQLGLGVQVHYIPVYFHPYYQALGYRRGSCPVAEDFYARCVSLPLHPGLTEDQVDMVIERVLCASAETL